MMMGHASFREEKYSKHILKTFGDASRMSINNLKSQIFFLNTPILTQLRITKILGFQKRSLATKFLGAPLIKLALKNISWKYLIVKLESKLSLWTFRDINFPCHLILLKSVL